MIWGSVNNFDALRLQIRFYLSVLKLCTVVWLKYFWRTIAWEEWAESYFYFISIFFSSGIATYEFWEMIPYCKNISDGFCLEVFRDKNGIYLISMLRIDFNYLLLSLLSSFLVFSRYTAYALLFELKTILFHRIPIKSPCSDKNHHGFATDMMIWAIWCVGIF